MSDAGNSTALPGKSVFLFADCLQGARVPDELLRRRHECHGIFETAHASPANRETSIVILVAKSGFTAPHGKNSASLCPTVEHRRDVKISVGNESSGIFPVVREECLSYCMRGLFAQHGRERCIENGIIHDLIASLVIFVPTSSPVGKDDMRFILPDQVADGNLCFIVDGDFTIRIIQEHGLRIEHLRSSVRCLTLKNAILRGRYRG